MRGIAGYHCMSAVTELKKFAEEYLDKFAATKGQFIYHLKSKGFKGKTIFTLAHMKETNPILYKQQIAKYKGREHQPEIHIDCIDAKWKECVNFSTLNPLLIFQLQEMLGIPNYKNAEEFEILKFNIKDFKKHEFCLYDDNKSPKNQEAYKTVKSTKYREQKFLPDETVKYFAKCAKEKELPLLFGGVPHILVKGNVPLSLVDDVLKFKAIIKI